jgi:hypothetical protein
VASEHKDYSEPTVGGFEIIMDLTTSHHSTYECVTYRRSIQLLSKESILAPLLDWKATS